MSYFSSRRLNRLFRARGTVLQHPSLLARQVNLSGLSLFDSFGWVFSYQKTGKLPKHVNNMSLWKAMQSVFSPIDTDKSLKQEKNFSRNLFSGEIEPSFLNLAFLSSLFHYWSLFLWQSQIQFFLRYPPKLPSWLN